MIKNKLIIGILIAIILLFATTSILGWIRAIRLEDRLSNNQDEQEPEDEPVTVQTTRVRRQTLESYLEFDGMTQPGQTVNVIPKIPGQAEEVLVNVGDSVSKDDVLLRIDSEEMESGLRQAEAALRGAEANLERTEAGARKEELQQLREAVKQAEVNADSARTTYERMKALYEQEVISKQEYETAKTRWEVSKSQLASAKEQLAMAEAGPDEKDLVALRAQVDQARASLDTAMLQLNRATVTAPVDGVIAARYCQVGEMVSNTAPAFTIINIDTLKVVLRVGSRDIINIYQGQSAIVKLDSNKDDVFDGVVKTVSPMADPETRLFTVEVTVDNPDHRLKAGMYATVRIITEYHQDALVVPDKAIFTDEHGNAAVYVVEAGILHKRNVSTGIRKDSLRQITDGLYAGDLVVVDNITGLVPGLAVRGREVSF